MGETTSINRLFLMFAIALLYPPALRALLAPESRSRLVLGKLWKVTLPIAAVSWLLAYFWAQELRSPTFSIAAIGCLCLLLLPAGYALLSPAGSMRLGQLLLIATGTLAYAAACWVVLSLSAGATDATVESQTLVLGYLLLAPALAWALLPSPQPPRAAGGEG